MTSITMLASTAALVLASVVLIRYEQDSFRQTMVRNLSVQAQIIGANSASAILFDDASAASHTLAALESAPNITFAAICDPSGNALAAYRGAREAFGTARPSLGPDRTETYWFTSNSLWLAHRITFRARPIGIVYIASDLRESHELIVRYIRTVAAVLTGSLLVVFLLSFLLQRAITQPIVRLVETARQVSRHRDFSLRAPKSNSGDEVAVLVNTFNDMLGQIQEREEERQKFVSLIEQTDDFIGMADLDHRVIYVNQAGCRLVGLELPDARGTPIERFFPERWWTRLRDEILPAIIRGDTNWTGEAQLCDVVSKRPLDVLMNAFSVRDPANHRTVCFAFVIRDISDRKQLEEQFRQSQKLESIGQLAGGVAHDFNNLLVVITGYASMLLDDPSLTDKFHEPIQQIAQAGDRAAALTRQLLVFSRRQKTELRDVVINELLADTEKMLRRLIGEDIGLTLALQEDAGVLRADPGQIEQVIMNLAVNARDAMPRGGKLLIETAHLIADEDFARMHLEVVPGEYVMLSVTDNGAGMTADVKARIFEPFFTTKEKGKGTGLGLSTVYGIVKQSNGSIWVYSEPGHGSAFKMLFPAVSRRNETPVAAVRQIRHGQGETILLAEDEEGVRAYLSQLLAQHGYRVLGSENGTRALEIAASHAGAIDLLLTDVVMPEMGGLELAERFSAAHPTVPVIYMSGYSDRIWSRPELADKVLQKPFTSAVLLSSLRKLLEAPATSGAEPSKKRSESDA